MLYLSALFFVISLVAALFGFGGIAGASAVMAKVLFFIFITAFVVSAIFHLKYELKDIHSRDV